MSNARNYTNKTYKRLYALSGNQCAFPDCEENLVNSDNAQNSNICHIEAKNEGGERFNSNMTNKQRDDYPNLILLCVQHHDTTNDFSKYTVEKLKQMKQNHESEVAEKISPKERASAIVKVVNKIAEIDIEKIQGSEVKFSFKPEDKIQYNNIKIYKPLFEKYKIYSTQLNTIYNEMDAEGSLKKSMILRNIQSIYLMIKGELNIETRQDIESHADTIIDKVKNKLFDKLDNSHLDEESMGFAVEIILIDAFMRCKILEEPK